MLKTHRKNCSSKKLLRTDVYGSEIESIANKNLPIYDILTHYYKDKDPVKSDLYFKKADELDEATNNSAFQTRIILKVGFEKFIKLANEAFENGTLDLGIAYNFFCYEYRNHPKLRTIAEKVQKGK